MPSGVYVRTPEHKAKVSESCRHKGKVHKRSIHGRIIKKYGKADHCEICGKNEIKIKLYNWANLDHKYSEDIKDWKQMCNSCHIKYDIKHNNRGYLKNLGNKNI